MYPFQPKCSWQSKSKKRGVLRLSDLLAEEPGMLQVHYFGSGIQLQGFDAEYTLILIDGQPVIGRNGGTLDLDRFAVSDIESVEIVQGAVLFTVRQRSAGRSHQPSNTGS